MRREGRQHGMVRSCMVLPPPWNPRPKSKVVNEFTSRPTAGIYKKVQSKPTNHSKFTGVCRSPRCAGCPSQLARKSRGNAKGTHKIKSNDVTLNHRLVTWRVVDDKRQRLDWDEVNDEMDYYDSYCPSPVSDSYCPSPVPFNEEIGRGLNWDEVDGEMKDDLDLTAVDHPLSVSVDEEIGQSGTEINGDDMALDELERVWEFVDHDDEDWCLVGSEICDYL